MQKTVVLLGALAAVACSGGDPALPESAEAPPTKPAIASADIKMLNCMNSDGSSLPGSPCKLYSKRSGGRRSGFSYTFWEATTTPEDPEEAKRVAKLRGKQHMERTLQLLREGKTLKKQSVWVADVAINYGKGWLAGQSRGEWGGELIYVSETGDVRVLVEDNIDELFKMSFGYIAIGGLAHMWSSGGSIYIIKNDERGEPQAELWKELPGSPRRFCLLDQNRLLIEVNNHNLNDAGPLSRIEYWMIDRIERLERLATKDRSKEFKQLFDTMDAL